MEIKEKLLSLIPKREEVKQIKVPDLKQYLVNGYEEIRQVKQENIRLENKLEEENKELKEENSRIEYIKKEIYKNNNPKDWDTKGLYTIRYHKRIDVIPKSKVKEKIEELSQEDLEIYDTDSEDLVVAKYEQRAVLDVLQEFLREE